MMFLLCFFSEIVCSHYSFCLLDVAGAEFLPFARRGHFTNACEGLTVRYPANSPTPRQSKPHAHDAPRSSVLRPMARPLRTLPLSNRITKTNFPKRDCGYEH